MKIVNRSEISVEEYREIMEKESHHNHEIVEVNGVLRWKENSDVRRILKNISLNDLCPLLICMGYDKNSEVYRKLYRDMGYSLSGYWEIFYWELNNDNKVNYNPICVHISYCTEKKNKDGTCPKRCRHRNFSTPIK